MSIKGRWKNTGSVSKSQQDTIKKVYQSRYNEERQKAIFDEAERDRKSIEERLSADRFLSDDDRRQLQKDIYRLKSSSQMLAALGFVDKSYVDHVNTLQKLKGDASRFYANFKDENEYFDYTMRQKYGINTVKDVDNAIGAKSPFGSKSSMLGKFKIGSASDKDTKELDWLIKNRDSFMTPEEIRAEIQKLEGNSRNLDYQKTRSLGLGLDTYKQDKENADKNAKRLNDLKNLYASHPDVTSKDLDEAFKQSDNSFFDIFRKDYSYSDYKNDKADKRIYGAGYYAKREQEELAKINSDKRSFKVLGGNYTANELFNSYYDTKEKLDSGYYDKDDYGQARFEAERFLDRAKTALLQGGYDFKNTYDAYSRAKNREFVETLNEDARNAVRSGAFGATLANVGSLVTNVVGGVQAIPETIKGAIKDASTDSPYIMDVNSSAWVSKNATDAVRSATSEIIAEGKGGKIGEFLYQTGMSTADFLTTSAMAGFNPTASLMLMGTTAAADAVKQTSLKGGTATDALVMGVISGGLEILLEKTPIDEIFKSVNTKSGRDAIKNVFSAMMSEGFEEFGSEIGNTVADLLINADQSDFKQRVFELMESGMSSSSASVKVFGETLGNAALSFLGGALSGGAMAGVGNISALSQMNRVNRAVGNAINSNGQGDALLDFARELAGTKPNIQQNENIQTKPNMTIEQGDIRTETDNIQGKRKITDAEVIEGMSAGRSLEPTRASVTSPIFDSNINTKTLEKLTDKATQKQSNRNMGKLYSEAQRILTENKTKAMETVLHREIANRIVEVGGDKSIADRGANIIMKAYNGEQISLKEQRILNGQNSVAAVYKEYISFDNGETKNNSWVKSAELKAAEIGRKYDSYSDRAVNIISEVAPAKSEFTEINTITESAMNDTQDISETTHSKYEGIDYNGETVAIKSIGALTENGVEVTLDNSETLYVSDEATDDVNSVYVPDENVRRVIETASIIPNSNIKKGLIENFDGESDAKIYTAEYSKAVFDGILGKKDKNAINSKVLSVDQYNVANSIGANAKNSKIDAYDIVQGISASKLNNGVTKAYGAKKISKHMQDQINVLDAYGKKYGTSFVVTDTINRGGSNGIYVGGNKIVVALDSEAGALLSVAGHEVFHLIEQNNAEYAEVIKKNVIANLKLKENYNYDARVNELMTMYNTDDIGAIESEMVGNAFFDVIANENVIKELCKDNGKLLDRVVKAFNEFIDRIINAVKALHWAEADALVDDVKLLCAIRNMCETSLNNIKALEVSDYGIAMDDDGNVFHSHKANPDLLPKKYSYDSIAKSISEKTGVDVETIKVWLEVERNLYKYEKAFSYDSDDRYSAIKTNSDYPQGTVDFSNRCVKRAAITETFEEIQRRHPNTVFTAEDMTVISNFLRANGVVVACSCCFVEDRRQKVGEIAKEFIDEWTRMVNATDPEERRLKKTNSEGKTSNLNITAVFAKKYGLKSGAYITPQPDADGNYYIPSQYDITTYEGYRKLFKEHRDIAIAFERYNNARGQSSIRLIEGRAEYMREIMDWKKPQIDKCNNNGGLRIFSFSDFEIEHLLDLIQIINDCAAKGITIQCYTKQPEFAYILKDTGAKINRSFIPRGTGIKKVNGKDVLDYDLVEGINIKSPYFDNEDNPNVGNVLIGISKEQIRLAMISDEIDYIIPFHTNKRKEILLKLGIDAWLNYKKYQTDKIYTEGWKTRTNKETGEKERYWGAITKTAEINIYKDILNKPNPPKNKFEFVNAFLKIANDKGITPRFSEFLETDADGKYIYTEGYHKFLVDYKLFDKEGNILPQKPVKPIYNENVIKVMNELATKREADYDANRAAEFKFVNKDLIDKLDDRLMKGKVEALDTNKQYTIDATSKIADTIPSSIKHSLKQYKDIQRDLEKSEAKYEDLKRANEELKKQLKYSRGRAITMNDAKNIAAEAISKYASTVKSTTLGKRLFDLFQWVDKVEGTDDFAWDFVMDTLIGEAREVIRNQDYYEDVEDYFLDIKREIQGTRFRLSEDIWHNTNDARSPYNRRAYGKFEVARYDDMSVSDLSEQWAAWEGMFGGPFVGVSDGEMPDRLLEIWDMCTSPTYYDMVEINGYPDAETAAVALAHDMFEMYLESPSYQTYADKQKARREELKAQVKQYKSLVSSVKREMGKEYTEVKKQRDKLEEKLGLTEDKLKEIATEYKKTVAKLGRRDARLSATREELRTTKDKLKRRDKALDITRSILRETKEELKDVKHKEDLRVRAKMRTHVKARLDQLYRRYTNPKPGAYIPDGLKPIVKAFFEMFDGDEGYVKPEMMGAVMEQYRKLTEVSSSIETFYDPDMLETLDKLAKAMEVDRAPDGQERTTTEKLDAVVGTLKVVKGNSRLYKFDEQTTALFETVANHLFSLVSNANKTFIEGKKVEFDAVIADAIESYSKPMDKKVQAMFKMTNWNSTPYYFFKRLGGTFNKVYKDLMAGQHKSGLMLQQAKNAMSVIREKHNATSWMRDTERSIKVDTSYKEHLEFTVGEALGIYAVAKREASTPYKETNHLRGNGIIFTDKKGKDNRGIANHQLSDADVRKIVGQLTDEQIAYADDVIKYMSTTVAEWGNEISEQLHGYKKFTETTYYPYHISEYEKSGSAMSADKPDDVVPLIKNRSYTKSTVHGAQAAVKVEDFVKVANDHIKEMIDYHCLSIPQSVLNSIYSYKKGGKAITQMLDMNYDKTSSVYVKQFIKDVSLGSAIDINEKIIQKLLGKFKKNAVAMNIRVIVQQPSAIGRAMALVDPKYFLTKARNPSAGYEELKKYSGVAVIKEIGGFDIATGYGITNWIMQAPPENFKDKVKTFFDPKDSSYRDEIFGMGAQKADEITWVHIWEAVKKETADKNPSLKGEDLMIKAGLRFNEVIEATQVYDSVLARSQVMRSKTNTMKTLTSFMAEPTKRINMLYDAAYDFINGKDKKTAGKFLARTCGAIIVSAVLNSILKAPITAGRDDDETKSYIDKLLYALMNESMSDLSVLQGLPFIKDIISMLQGYDPSAGGMSLFNDLIDSFTGLIKPDKDAEEWKDAIVDAVGSLGAFAGVPAKNIMRDVEALMRIGVSIFDNKKPSRQSAKFSVLDGFVDMFEVRFGYSNYNPLGFMKPSEQDVYEAMLNGEDGEYELEFDKLQAYLIYGGKSSEEAVDAIESKVRDLIKENFNNGSIDWATAEKLLLEYFPDDMEEHAAYWKLREWQAKAENPDKSSFSKYDDLSEAILSGSNLEGAIDELISHGTDSDAIETKILNVIKNDYFNDDIDLKKAEELLRKCMEYDKGNDDLALSVQDDTDVKRKLDIWKNSKNLPDGETYSPFDMLNAEIVAGKPLSDKAKQKLYDLDYKDSDIKAQIPKALKEAFLNGDIDIKEAEKLLRGYSNSYGFKEKDIRRNLDIWENSKDLPKGETYTVWNVLETAVAEGKPITKEQRDKFTYLDYDDNTVNSHISKVIKEGYEEGTITRKTAEKRLLDYKVIDINDYQDSDNPTEAANKAAANKVKVWDFKREHPESDLTNDNVILDYVEAANEGISLDIFEDYYKKASNCKGVDANGDGKTDSGSKKDQILRVIHDLPLTPAQKDILYFQNGWSAKTLYKDAPWH